MTLDKMSRQQTVKANTSLELLTINRWAKAIGWLGIIVFALFAVFTLSTGRLLDTVFACSFILLSVICLSRYGEIAISQEAITYHGLWGHYEMKWDEVTHIEIGRFLIPNSMILIGDGKRLRVARPTYWSGATREVVVARFANEIGQRQIKIIYTWSAIIKRSRNTKIE